MCLLWMHFTLPYTTVLVRQSAHCTIGALRCIIKNHHRSTDDFNRCRLSCCLLNIHSTILCVDRLNVERLADVWIDRALVYINTLGNLCSEF